MKIIFAPDSYKGALRADKVAEALASGWHSVRPQDELICLPLSDGGEGMAQALAAAMGGNVIEIDTFDALMRPIKGRAVVIEDTAIVETAEANGLEKLSKDELDPLMATTYGVGVMMKKLLDLGCRKFIAGIGGSATVNGGAGMLQALGAKLFDRRGNELPPGAGGGILRHVAKVELSTLDERLKDTEISVACDVKNPLTGKEGAAEVFGPQKGATGEMVPALDENLHHWAELFDDEGNHPGDGAAGGLGFALRKILNGKLISGAELIIEKSGFISALHNADWVVTGEGCSDEQTAYGKLCSVVAAKAHAHGVPVVLVSGALKGDTGALEKVFDGCFSIAQGPVSLEKAIADTAVNLRRMGANLAHLTGRK